MQTTINYHPATADQQCSKPTGFRGSGVRLPTTASESLQRSIGLKLEKELWFLGRWLEQPPYQSGIGLKLFA